jgi:hypothetical protein
MLLQACIVYWAIVVHANCSVGGSKSVKHLVVGCASSVLAIAWTAFVMFASEEVVYVKEICNNYLSLLESSSIMHQPPPNPKNSTYVQGTKV